MKRILFLLMALMFAITAQSQGEITIGSGTGTTFYVPMYCNYNYSYSQTIYNSSEIIGGTISQIAYYMTSTDARTENFVIYAGNSTKSVFASNTDYEPLANLTQVFSGTVTFNQGWNYITLTTPFVYNGIDNLLIAIDKNTGNYASRSWQSHSSSFASCLYYYQDNTDVDPNAPAASNKDFGSSRPNTKFIITPNDPGFCFAPSNLAYSNVLTNQATITWDANLNVASYLVEYKTSSQDWADATLFPGISGSTHVITNLNANTQYNIRVTPECTSALSSIISLRTSCATITQFPWIEGFESDWVSPVSPGDKPAPNCWIVVNKGGTTSSDYYASTDFWWKYTSSTSSHSGSGHASCYTDYGINNHNDWLITPQIALTGNERLRFWAMRSSSSTEEPDEISVFISDENAILDTTGMGQNGNLTGFTQIFTQLLPIGDWQLYEINLSQYSGTRYIAFVRQGTPDGYNLRLDDVEVSTIPNCFPPTEIAMSNITSDQADLNFTPAEITGPSWNVMLKNLSTNATVTEPIYSLPHTFYNLTPNTNYSVSIITDCGDGTFSDPTLPLTFRTQCVPATIPYLEDFSSSVIVEPTCWTRMSGLLADISILTPTTSGWTHSTVLDNAMRVNISGTGVKYWLISPTIDLGMDGSLYQLDLDVVYSDLATGLGDPTHSDDDIFAVVVSSDNGATWSKANARIWYASPDSTYSLTSFSPTSTHISLKLEDENMIPYSGNIKIALYGESTVALSGADNFLFVDNFAIDLAPMCPAVFNTTASVDNFSTIRVNFATDNAEPGIGWDIAYAETDPTSFDPNAATIVSVNDATELPYIITGLNAGSTYSLSVRQNCGGEWSPADSTTIPDVLSSVTLPYVQNFDDLNNISEWTLSNPDTNKWYIGANVVSPDGIGNTMYISTNGDINAYAHKASHSYAYSIIDFGNLGAAEYEFSFDWKSGGESTWDFFKVYLLPIDAEIPATGFPTTPDISGILNLNNEWQRANIILPTSVYENTVKKLLFVWKNDGTGGDGVSAVVDNIQIIPLSCVHPSNLSFDTSSITQTSVELSWTENATAENWIVEYSIDGLTWISEAANTNTNFVLSGLNHSTPYKVRVKSVCNESEFSTYSNRVSFTTECGTINIPYVQNFDNDGTGSPILPICWSRLSNQSTSTLYPYISTTNQSGEGSLYFYADSAKYNIGILPEIDASVALNSLQLTFYYRKGSAASNLIIGAMSDPSDITTFDSITTVTASATSVWELKEVNLDSYQGAGTYIAFKNSGPAAMTSYIDGLNIDLIPSCPNTYSLTSVSSSYDKVILNWNSLTYAGQGYEVSYSPVTSGFDPNNGTIVSVADNTTMTPFAVTGLISSNTYSFAVRQACGGDWSNIITVTTLPSPAQIPYICDFDNEAERESWVISNTTTNNKWVIGTAVDSELITGYSLYVSKDNGVTNEYAHSLNTIVASRFIEFDGSDAYILTFNSRVGGEGTTTMYDFFKVYLVDEDTNYVGVASTPYYGASSYSQGALLINGNPYFNNPSNSNNINNHYIEIPSQGEAGTIKRLVFVWRNDVSGGTQPPVSIDNISITALTCSAPIIAASSVSQNDITLSWTPSTSDIGWTIFYKESTDTYYDSSNYITTPPPYVLSGLTVNTVYNIYIKTDCGSDLSNASNILNVQTLCDPIISLPYTENFDSYGTASGTYPSCWQRPIINSGYPSIVTAYSSSAPASLKFQSLPSAPTYAISPQIDADINTLQLSFKVMKEGSNSGKIIVGVMSSPTDTATFEPVMTFETMEEDIWIYNEVNFDNTLLSGNNNFIAFKHQSLQNNWFYWIDDVSINATPSCARPSAISASSLTNSIDVTITPADASDTEWMVYYRNVSSPDWDSLSSMNTIFTIPNLLTGTEYEIYAKTVCFDGSYSNASNSIISITQQISEQVPYTCDFETPGNNGWLLKNGTCTNKWMIGTPTSGASNALFVSNNNADATYNLNTFSVVVAEKLFEFSTSDSIILSFDLSVGGESSFDYLKVFLVDKDTVFNPSSSNTYFATSNYAQGIIMSNGANKYINLLTGTQTLSTSFISPGVGVQKKLIFVWRNDGSGGNTQSSIVDNISITTLTTCDSPTGLVATPNSSSVDLVWNSTGTEIGWHVRQGLSGAEIDVSSASYTATGLSPETEYTYYIRSKCSLGEFSPWASVTFTTLEMGDVAPVVTTTSATAITGSQATLNATIVEGTEPITSQGFEYKTQASNTWIDQVVATGTTPFTYTLTGLSSGTAYQARAYANTATDGRIYGNEITFTTITVVSPIVTTEPITNITQSSATFNGTITENTEAIEARGFEYKLSSEAWEDAVNISATGTTTISANATNLDNTLEYNVRAYARTASGKTYGSIISFQLLSLNGATGQEISVMIYPNPATSQTNLVVNGINGETKIVLSDVQGRILNTINTKPLSGRLEQTIDLSNLAKGVYYIRIQNSDINRTQKLIVK